MLFKQCQDAECLCIRGRLGGSGELGRGEVMLLACGDRVGATGLKSRISGVSMCLSSESVSKPFEETQTEAYQSQWSGLHEDVAQQI